MPFCVAIDKLTFDLCIESCYLYFYTLKTYRDVTSYFKQTIVSGFYIYMYISLIVLTALVRRELYITEVYIYITKRNILVLTCAFFQLFSLQECCLITNQVLRLHSLLHGTVADRQLYGLDSVNFVMGKKHLKQLGF